MLRRRWLIAVILLLGATSTVGIAWGLAAWAPVSGNGPRVSGAFERWDRAWNVTRIDQFGVRLHWWSNLADDEPIRSPAALLKALGPRPSTQHIVAERRRRLEEIAAAGRAMYPVRIDHAPPGWGTFAGEPLPHRARIGSDTAFGWPAPCLWYQVTGGFDRITMSTIGDELAGALLLHGSPESRAQSFRALPLRPIWRGLAVNTVFFSALWALLLLAPPAVRRRLRRQRGRCPRCGYDLRGQASPGCPECGAGRTGAEE